MIAVLMFHMHGPWLPGGNYFAPRIEFNPYAHTWSLGVEEQFYLVFPLLFYAWLSLRSRDRRISVWDPFDTLCPRSACEAVVDGTLLFFDGDHLSGDANTRLYPVFLAFLRELPRD